MKNKISAIIILITITSLSLTSCAKYEKDESYSVDLYGNYSNSIEASNTSYSKDIQYYFNADNTYDYTYKEIINGTINNNIDINGQILSIEEISDNITQIKLDKEVTDWSTNETSNELIYKYQNMLGTFYSAEIPDDKYFDLQLNDYCWFDKEGQYHLCDGINCQCDTSCPKYIRKNNIIYFQSMDEEHKDCYTIGMYVVDEGVFIPKLYKTN